MDLFIKNKNSILHKIYKRNKDKNKELLLK